MGLNTLLPSTPYIQDMDWIKSTASGTILPVNFTIIRYEVHYFLQWLALIHPSLLSWYSLWDSPNNNATLCSDFFKNYTSLDSLWIFILTKNSKHKCLALRPQLSLQLTSTQSHTRPELSFFGARQGISHASPWLKCSMFVGVALHFSKGAGKAVLPVAGKQSAPSSLCWLIYPGSKFVLQWCRGPWAGCELLVHLAGCSTCSWGNARKLLIPSHFL